MSDISALQALLPKDRGGAAGYQDVAIASLPENVAAAGVRHGVTDHVQVLAPIEINLHGTGQSSRAQESTFRENYASADRGACSTVQRMLAGFAPPQWGTTTAAPLSPRLECLKDIGVDLEQLDVVVDELYNIHSASEPYFQKGGRLRAFVQACAAAQLKAYAERVVSASSASSGFVCIEMRSVCLKMQTVVRQHYAASLGMEHDVHLTLVKWSQHISLDFETRNIDMLTRRDAGEPNATQNTVIARLADTVSNLAAGVTSLHKKTELAEERHELCASLLNQLLERADAADAEKEKLRRDNARLREALAAATGSSSSLQPGNDLPCTPGTACL